MSDRCCPAGLMAAGWLRKLSMTCENLNPDYMATIAAAPVHRKIRLANQCGRPGTGGSKARSARSSGVSSEMRPRAPVR
jgi:hypothetical protein